MFTSVNTPMAVPPVRITALSAFLGKNGAVEARGLVAADVAIAAVAVALLAEVAKEHSARHTRPASAYASIRASFSRFTAVRPESSAKLRSVTISP